MISEQNVTCRYKIELQGDIEIQMRVQLERPSKAYGDVLIELNYERIFPEELEDQLHQRLYNGVHGGYALSGIPYLPNTILVVRVLELKVMPLPQNIKDIKDKINLGYLLEVTISGVVESLLRNMENLRTGKETYYK
jgi:hypothetical protein